MRIEEIVWDEDAVSHIARHGVQPNEVEEACFNGKPYILKARLERYIVLGQADSGRYLTIVFKHLGQARVKIVTARAMSKAECRMFKRR